MSMKIWHQSFTTLARVPEYNEKLRAHIKKVVRPDTEVVVHGTHAGTHDHRPGAGPSTARHFADVRAFICIVLLGLSGQLAWSQEFPTRPIRLVVGFAPGGSTDIVARIVAKEMSAQLGQQVIVENRSGASAAIATDLVAKAVPDGHTLCFCTLGAMVILPMIEKVPYNPDKDLVPIIHVVNQPFVVVVRSSLNVSSLKDFIALAKANPGKITFGSPGTATPSHLTGELLALATGTQLTHVPYKGDAPAIQDLLGGHVDAMMLSAIGVKPLVDSGRVKALAVSSLTRVNVMPAGAKIACKLLVWNPG